MRVKDALQSVSMHTMLARRTGRPPLSPEPKIRRSVILFESHDRALRAVSDATGICVSELIRRSVESMLQLPPQVPLATTVDVSSRNQSYKSSETRDCTSPQEAK